MANSVGAWDGVDGVLLYLVFVALWTGIGVFVVPSAVSSIIGKRKWAAMLGVDAIVWTAAWALPHWKGLWHVELLVLMGCAALVAGVLCLAGRGHLRRILVGSVILVLMTTGVVVEGLRLQDKTWANGNDGGIRWFWMQDGIWRALNDYYCEHHAMPSKAQWKDVVIARRSDPGGEHLRHYAYTGVRIDADPAKPLVYRYLDESMLGVVPKRTIVLYTDGKTAVISGWHRY